jgi:transcriptional regulator with XRE-family HTH domain
MARAAVGWTVRQMSANARVGTTTINRFEQGLQESTHSTIAALQRALEEAGVRFTAEGCVCPPK